MICIDLGVESIHIANKLFSIFHFFLFVYYWSRVRSVSGEGSAKVEKPAGSTMLIKMKYFLTLWRLILFYRNIFNKIFDFSANFLLFSLDSWPAQCHDLRFNLRISEPLQSKSLSRFKSIAPQLGGFKHPQSLNPFLFGLNRFFGPVIQNFRWF